MRKLIARPAAILVSDEEGEKTILAMEAWLTDEADSPSTVEMVGDYDINYLDVTDIEQDLPGLLQAVTVPSSYPVTVRPIEESDSIGISGMPSYSLPIPVIVANLSGENMDTHIEALSEDDGFVSTLLLVTDVGLFLRFSGQWIRLVDLTTIDGLNAVEVSDDAVDLYDAADQAGNQLLVSSLPGPDQDTSDHVSSVYTAGNVPTTFPTESVTAGAVSSFPSIMTVDDLPHAIEMATADSQLRWFVARRARALRWDQPLPWEVTADE